nr:hypothetical protein K-LCC10_0290 [Kaumoebavirus]
MEQFSIVEFCRKELTGLLHKEFPYLTFTINPNNNILNAFYGEEGICLDIKITDKEIGYGKTVWHPKDKAQTLDVFKEILQFYPQLAFVHCKYEIGKLDAKLEKIITMLTYAPGGPGYEEAKEDFNMRL